MCGGSGTRLWPLSRRDFPKQFIPLMGDDSLLGLALDHVQTNSEFAETLCVGNEDHRFLISELLDKKGMVGDILLEPEGRNTAPALVCAALDAIEKYPDAILVCMASDHYIPDRSSFAATLSKAAQLAAQSWWVTLGIEPTFPSTAYGYIAPANALAKGAYEVAQFVEKPNVDKAEQYVADGYRWNAGIFVIGAQELLDACEKSAGDILASCRAAMQQPTRDDRFVRMDREAFLGCRAESIDYAVLEHHEHTAMVDYDGVWNDVGSWNAIADLSPADPEGNRSDGDARFVDSTNTFIYSPDRHIATLGVENLVVVDTPDALLVADRSRIESIKEIVAQLKEEARPEATTNSRVIRPWGAFEAIDGGEGYQAKRLSVTPGASLSLQSHEHRAEHWVVVRGVAEVTKDGKVFNLQANESTYIPKGTQHRLANRGTELLEIIEVQTGDYLGEDDIVRYEDEFGRAED